MYNHLQREGEGGEHPLPPSYSLLKFVYLTGQWCHSLEVHITKHDDLQFNNGVQNSEHSSTPFLMNRLGKSGMIKCLLIELRSVNIFVINLHIKTFPCKGPVMFSACIWVQVDTLESLRPFPTAHPIAKSEIYKWKSIYMYNTWFSMTI